MSLDEIPYWRKGTLEKYEPWGDYVVVKFSRWAFEKFKARWTSSARRCARSAKS